MLNKKETKQYITEFIRPLLNRRRDIRFLRCYTSVELDTTPLKLEITHRKFDIGFGFHFVDGTIISEIVISEEHN
jgi:hypothetical protein